jgi:carboxyvinyl-carboxyphosphonate phosphorylmutase
MHWTKRREQFRAILTGATCVHPASVYDPISARIAEDLGYEMGMYAGSTASLTVLGAPDIVLLTLSEFAGQALRIARAGELPFLVDADHGYGNALNVKRTVEELETAGVAGLTIEDTSLPAAFGDGGKPRLISIEEGVGKMRAALAGRQDPSLVIVGRTSAPVISGIDDTVKRIKAYEAAGVDAVFLAGVATREEIAAGAAAVKCPVILGNVKPALADRAWLASIGVRVCLQGHLPIAAATRAVYDVMKALRDGTPPEALAGAASEELMKRVTRDQRYKAWTKEFLGG